MTPHLQKLVDTYHQELGQKQTFQAILELAGSECTAVLLTILEDQGDPRRMLTLLSDWRIWLKQLRPQAFNEAILAEPGPTPESGPGLTAGISPEQKHVQILERKVRMGDTIKLKALSPQAELKLARWGMWWVVVAAHDYDRRKPPPNNRPPSWFLKSIPRRDQGLAPLPGDRKHPLENLWICKVGDLNYRIINICSFPKEFKWKEWAGKENVILG
jgi:hypothetical protein